MQNNRSGKAIESKMIKFLTMKNVRYSQGIPKSIQDLERVYTIDIVSPIVSSTLTTGAKATSTSLDVTSRVDTFSRWATVFKQYVVLGITVVSQISGTNGGSAANGQIWQRVEEDSSAPSGAMVKAEKAVISLHAPSDDKMNSSVIMWRPTSSEDLEWIATGTGFANCYLKTYADPTNTGTSASDSSSQISSLIYYTVAFRYLA